MSGGALVVNALGIVLLALVLTGVIEAHVRGGAFGFALFVFGAFLGALATFAANGAP